MEPSVSPPRRGWRILRRVIWFCLVTSVPGYLAVSILIAHVLTQPNNRLPQLDPSEIGSNVRPWSTRTADGLTLRGWYCPTVKPRRLIVLVHGMGGNMDEMAEIGRDLHARGYSVLLFDLRGHGASDPSRLFMGARERGDIRAVLAWAKEAGFTPDRIGWIGHSMGGATLLMEGETNREIGSVVLDSPYGDLPELLDRQLTEHSHLPRLFNPGILLAARFVYGVRTDDLVPIRSAERWNRPVVLIHGESDSIVPIDQARKLATVLGSNCQAQFRPEVEHVGAYSDAPEWYIDTVDAFFRANLAP